MGLAGIRWPQENGAKNEASPRQSKQGRQSHFMRNG